MIRFHRDEQVDHAIARSLRGRGIDVTTTIDAGLQSAAGEEHLAFALREGRVVFTHDADFLRLSAQGLQHAGIVYCAPGSRSVGQIVRFRCLVHDCLAARDVAGKIEHVPS